MVHQFLITALTALLPTLPAAALCAILGVALNKSTKRVAELDLRLVIAEYEARTDALTGIENRRAIIEHLTAQLASTEPVSIAIIDIDQFKAINDTYGHDAGDAALQHVAQALLTATTGDQYVGRLAGDEFLIVIPGGLHTALRTAHTAAQRTHETMINADGTYVSVRISIGVAVADDTRSPGNLKRRADHALYHAKGSTTGICYWTPSMRMPQPPTAEPKPTRRAFR